MELQVLLEMLLPFTFALSLAGMGFSLIKQRMTRRGVGAKQLEAIEHRLLRIEQAVDAVAVEVERIAEAQRFTTRLLAERGTDHEPISARHRVREGPS